MAVRVLQGESLDVLDASPKHSSIYQTSSSHLELSKNESSDSDPMSDDEICVENADKNVTLGDIVKQVGCYFKIDTNSRRKDPSLEKQLILRDCEDWLKRQFLVERFECLGHGNFFDFLEKQASAFPSEVNDLLNRIFGYQHSIEIFMSQQQFLVVLSQAARNFSKSSKLTDEHISMILRKQFPVVALHMTKSGCIESLNLIHSQRLPDVSVSVTFSVSLLGDCCGKSSLSLEENVSRELPGKSLGRGEFTGIIGSVSTEDAIKCLLRAPMLSDLKLWSHWDFVFGPSLGPLLDWLLDLGFIKELSCIVTTDSRIIRIDHSATIDGFLEALAQASPFHTAVQLLSLFHVYGGSKSIPVSLLRCYAQCGIDAIIKCCMGDLQVNAHATLFLRKGSVQGQSTNSSFDGCRTATGSTNGAHSIVSLFILDCLGYLPSEFHSFTADVLISAFQFFTRDAAAIILKECRGVEECFMLHEIGFSLGIVEWIEDYKQYSAAATVSTFEPSGTQSTLFNQCSTSYNKNLPGIPRNTYSEDGEIEDRHEVRTEVTASHKDSVCSLDKCCTEMSCDKPQVIHGSASSGDFRMQDAAVFIETIRREEFGLNSALGTAERNLLKKQHARLGRALQCLSQELYSQDSHFILELVQNADDNIYDQNVEPTLIFILHDSGIVVMNNELGFSDKNIRALCDVGNSTKKGSSGGYIGQKGIGFKSVFRITDAPEIHSNGFHVKFDITEGQIGFVLPTIIPPFDIDFYETVLHDSDEANATPWKTCIVLPFKPKLKQGKGISPVISMFADLHPSLLLFLQRLKCIMFKNMLDGKLVSMRRETVKDGIVIVSQGHEKLNWLVVRKSLQASLVRPDVQSTKIAMAFSMELSDNGDCLPLLDQQPVFSFLPLRKYGLKFIIQGDFILPSSREEVDEDSAWNQWLLSEMPDLFVSAEKSFCALSCFKGNSANAITCFMSFVPLSGEVHGFFSPLPQMIVSKLCLSNCLLTEASTVEWVPPCRVLRNWNENLRTFLSNDLLQQHLGLSYLNKDIILSDTLARALGIQDYGPKILIRLISSICLGNCIKELGLEWLCSWLNALYTTLAVNSSGYLSSVHAPIESDLLNNLRKIPFIPLSDGSYCSAENGPIWFPYNTSDKGFEGENVFRDLPGLYAELRTVNSCIFTMESRPFNVENRADNIIKVLHKIGIQKLSAHNVIRNHILQSICDEKSTNKNADLMIEYVIFIMLHFQSSCFECNTERDGILQELHKRKILLTNHGYICPGAEPVHFSKDFGNGFDIKKLLDGMNIKWNEVDAIYLKHPSTESLPLGLMKWRDFLKKLAVTDFVKVNQVERICSRFTSMKCFEDVRPVELLVNDWESPELISILSSLSSNKCLEKSRYLLDILDKMWDGHFSTKARCFSSPFEEGRQTFQSSFVKCIADFKWVACSMDEEAHFPKHLFYDCETVRSLLGGAAPYAMPQVTSKTFVEDIGFKVTVTLDDAFQVLQIWRNSQAPSACISQMSKFYTFIWDELIKSEGKIIAEVKKNIIIFIPLVPNSDFMSVASGNFMLPNQLYWQDPTGCMDRIREASNSDNLKNENDCFQCITLDIVYPELHDFLVADCGVLECPPFSHYHDIMLHLSKISLPSDVALLVFKVFLKFSDDWNSGLVRNEDILQLKDDLLKSEFTVLPTVQDKWVSLHPRFGLTCWSDDEKLLDEYVHLNNVNFLYFGKLTEVEKEMLCVKVAPFLKMIGLPLLAEVINREAIFYGISDSTEETSLVNWILPYVQRYLYKSHSDIYCDLKESGFHKLTQLDVVVVEKLFYRNILQGNSSTSQKRYECKSLLQVNRLYTTPNADTHSMFLELSRFFFNGTPNLHMANFLHIITKELNSTEEQIESFILNNLNVPKLPEGEPIWSLVESPNLSSEEMPSTLHAFPVVKLRRLKPNRTSAKLNWPPAANTNTTSSSDSISEPHISRIPKAKPGITISAEESHIRSGGEATGDFRDDLLEMPPASTIADLSSSSATKEAEILLTSATELHDQTNLFEFTETDKLFLEPPEENQSYKTGRLGELVAYQYFSEKLGEKFVKWVNEESEMGLPYDLIIDEEQKTRFVEVKATTSATKDWFAISTKEWRCASEKGESYSIAWVILSGQDEAQVHVLNNPFKLCQQKLLQLVLLLPTDL
ncbi:uncharacterized protein LOC110020982 [Phalaenopsis equestris]|uniref:uncharacterized protein LOC110020982 n=1 Tax=Phalaenopsis equestris TaxID=78828 RepID=UPI0009E3A246|nr:uncharacterized protein LOC110020982 [Phalaenopsis equestris]